MGAPRLRSSIFARLARNATIVAVIAVLALLATTWTVLDGQMRRSLAANTATDLAGLVDIYATGGRAELLDRIADRTALSPTQGRSSHYLVATARGEPVAGDIAEWPRLNPALSEHGFVALERGPKVYARATRLDEDLDLLVAREYSADLAAIHYTALAFLAVGALVVLAVWWLARGTGRRLARRVERINAGFRDPDGSLAMPGRPDEIDELAYHGAESVGRMARLAASHKAMSDNVAHEIRTPLMHLDQRMVQALGSFPEPDGGPLTRARSDIRGIVSLLDSLLDIASNEARRGDRSGLEEIDLSALATQIGELYEGSFEDAALIFACTIEPGVTMRGEPMQLSRLISNLLDNAIKYVPAGGSVTLSVALGPRIAVADDGPGVPPERRAAIFERFERADKSDASGHGLGLALARAIAERHGLVLRLAESEHGATFTAEPE